MTQILNLIIAMFLLLGTIAVVCVLVSVIIYLASKTPFITDDEDIQKP